MIEKGFTQMISKKWHGGKNLWGWLDLFKKRESCLLGNMRICPCWGKSDSQNMWISVSLWEMKRLPSVSLVTMFKVSEKDITNYQQSDNYNKVNLWNFVEYSALWTSNKWRKQISKWVLKILPIISKVITITR